MKSDLPIGGSAILPSWIGRSAFQILVILIAFAEIALAMILYTGSSIWLAMALILIISHLLHGTGVALHEASHGHLRRNRNFNEFDGILIGVLSFNSFSLYRVVHQWHHAHMSTARDEEFWPFVEPKMPRWARIFAAFLELTIGLVFTPFLLLRAFLRAGSPIRNQSVRRRIWAELLLTVSIWALIVSAVSYWHVWHFFFWMFLVPAFLAGNLQTWRKYIEHVGLTGGTINSSTRSIVAKGWLGRLVAFTLLHEPLHGVHHRNAALSHWELPGHIADLTPKTADEIPPFPSYRQAFLHLISNLSDPRVGAQWNTRVVPS
jgi:fatty acid desaturase